MTASLNTEHTALISHGAQVLKVEARALQLAADRLGPEFFQAASIVLSCTAKVVVTGLGKSGHIARKMAATLASTGTPSFFLHPGEALHGDLGMLAASDVLIAIAYGGETEETLGVAKYARRLGVRVIAITGKKESSLGKLSDVVLNGAVDEEACPLNLAPTASSTLALALGDALAIAVMKQKGFTESSFASIHPGGSLGKKLMLVSDIMRQDVNAVGLDAGFADVMEKISKPNFGIVAVIGSDGTLLGAVTDGDIRRAIVRHGRDAVDQSVKELMSHHPKTITSDVLAVDAFRLMERHKITSLFVISDATGANALQGLIRMHDLLEQKIV